MVLVTQGLTDCVNAQRDMPIVVALVTRLNDLQSRTGTVTQMQPSQACNHLSRRLYEIAAVVDFLGALGSVTPAHVGIPMSLANVRLRPRRCSSRREANFRNKLNGWARRFVPGEWLPEQTW